MRFHLLATVGVVIAAIFTDISTIEWMIILILIGGMLALEIMNAAIERTIDYISTEKHPLAKQAKDLAAAAVLVFAIVSAIIGILIFIPKWF